MDFDEAMIQCPYCGESLSIGVDPSAGNAQSFVEDCHVCCQPIVVSITLGEDGDVSIGARREND